MDKIKVGIVGAGEIVRLVHLPVLKCMPDVNVVWLADIDSRTAKTLGCSFNVDALKIPTPLELLPECDIVLVATPVFARREYIQYFGSKKVRMLVEKPFALSHGEHQEYLSICGEDNVSCGYMRRTYCCVRALRMMVNERWFGSLRNVAYSEGARASRSSGSKTLDMSYRQGGGVLRDLGCHGLDTILYITGANQFSIEFVDVKWDGDTDRHVSAKCSIGNALEMHPTIKVDFCVSWLEDQSNAIVLEFENAKVRAGIRPDSGIEIMAKVQNETWIPLELDIPGAKSSYQAFYLEWREVIDASLHGARGDMAAGKSLTTSRLVDELYLSGTKSLCA